MQKITLKKLIIINFKGIKSLNIDFSETETNIRGANGLGKSSIMDAFTFLLFGKDAQDRKDFQIKNTVDTALNRQDHEVTAVLEINGKSETIKRVFREKWVKKQGSETREFTGHETLFFFNEVPLQAGEFKAKIDGILNEGVFKLLTNALAFNSLTWQARRTILFELAGGVTDAEVLTSLNKPEFNSLIEILNSGKSLEDYKKQIAGEKKTIKISLDEISPRIAENFRSIPEDKDWAAIEKEIENQNLDLVSIDTFISDKAQAVQAEFDVINTKQAQFQKYHTDKNALKFQIENSIREEQNKAGMAAHGLKNKVAEIESNISSKNTLLQTKVDVNTRLEADMAKMRIDWAKTKERQYVPDLTKDVCQTCNREFEANDIEEAHRIMKENFDTETSRLLAEIEKDGGRMKADVAANNELKATIESAISTLNTELAAAKEALKLHSVLGIDFAATVEEKLAASAEYQALVGKEAALFKELNETDKPVIDNSELTAKKQAIQLEMDGLKSQLSSREQIKNTKARIAELEAEEKSLSQLLAQLEGTEFTIDNFTKAKIGAIEEKINSKFKYCRFKMFNNLINGGTEETCVTMYGDVPWETLNTAGRIWAGIDIINTLSEHYRFIAPLILDNRESVLATPETKSQIINLIVSAGHDKLTVE